MVQVGKTLVALGAGLCVLGGFAWLLGTYVPGLRPGRLPGDIAIEKPGYSLYVPLGTMLIVSLLATIVSLVIGALRK